MKTNPHPNILYQALNLRFNATIIERHFPPDAIFNLIEKNKANRLLIQFLPENDFFEHTCFEIFQVENTNFQRFKGAFYCSTLPLVFKLYLLEDILKRADQDDASAFPPWTKLFRNFYNRKLITRRNMEMSGYLHLFQYLQNNSITV